MEQTEALQRLWAAIESLHNQVIGGWVDNNATSVSTREGSLAAVGLFSMRSWFQLLQLDAQAGVEFGRQSVLRRMNDHVAWALNKRNQFDQLAEILPGTISEATAGWIHELTSMFESAQQAQWTSHLNTVCASYLERLSQLVPVRNHGSRPFISEQYSVDLQLQVLRLDIDQISEPVLDIGCGKEGRLVQRLQQLQKRAMGIDLYVDATPDCVSIDWFNFPFVPNHYGTIIAHLSFSLQFLKHHLDARGQAERYAKLYMNILRSLQVGGRFIYVPGLPFIEKLLPLGSYRVQFIAIADFPKDSQASEIYSRYMAEDPMYCCQVERVRRARS